MIKFDEITIGYLSWKNQHKILETLSSHRDNGLFDIIKPENRIIFFQEICDTDIEIANKFNCKFIGNKENIGILKAFIELIENCNTKYFIFCENDFILLNNNCFDIKKTFEDVISLLDEHEYSQVKLSNIKTPGFLYCIPNNKQEWLKNDHKNYSYKVESFSWIDIPENYYSNLQIINKNYKWYLVNYLDQHWSNHIHICNIKFLKEVVLPLLKFNIETNIDLDIKYQGLEDVLINPYKYQGKNSYIDELINKLKRRIIIAGGGNFFHNK